MSTKQNPAPTNNPVTPALNDKEKAIIRQCAEGPATLEEMAKRFRRAKKEGQAHSWARNSVRKPVRLGLLKKVGRGTYNLTPKGQVFAKTILKDAHA